MTIAALKQEVDNLAEVFSEVEGDLDTSVYKLFAPHLDKVVHNMKECSSQMENMSAIMRLMALLNKNPEIKINIRNIETWETFMARGRPIPEGAAIDPIDPPIAVDIPQEVPRAAQPRAAGGTVRMPTFNEILAAHNEQRMTAAWGTMRPTVRPREEDEEE